MSAQVAVLNKPLKGEIIMIIILFISCFFLTIETNRWLNRKLGQPNGLIMNKLLKVLCSLWRWKTKENEIEQIHLYHFIIISFFIRYFAWNQHKKRNPYVRNQIDLCINDEKKKNKNSVRAKTGCWAYLS